MKNLLLLTISEAEEAKEAEVEMEGTSTDTGEMPRVIKGKDLKILDKDLNMAV